MLECFKFGPGLFYECTLFVELVLRDIVHIFRVEQVNDMQLCNNA